MRASHSIEKIKLRLSLAGILLLLFACSIFIAAINYSNNIMFMISFLLLAVLLVSLVFNYRQFKPVGVLNWQLNNIYANEKTNLSLLLVNQSTSAAYYLQHELNGEMTTQALLAANSKQTLCLSGKAMQRGLYHIDASTLISCWPLGLWRLTRGVAPSPDFYVYPARNSEQLFSHHKAADSAPEDESLDHLSAYRAGDKMSRISWKVYARQRQLAVKQLISEHNELDMLLDWTQLEGDTEQKLAYLSTVISQLSQGFILKMPQQKFGPDSGPRFKQACLNYLACYQQDDTLVFDWQSLEVADA